MFLSMQSLNGDSYQGAQVGANVQSQVGPPTRTVPDNAVQRAVPCLACVLDWAIHRAAWIITKKVDSIWPSIGYFALDGTFCLPKDIPPHCFQARLLARIPNISTYVNAFGFDLNSWVGIGFLGTLFSPFSCIFILLSHLVIVCCCLPFYTLYNAVTQHTHLVCTITKKKKHQK